MKMKEIEINKEYAALHGVFGKRPRIEPVEGMENFNPHCRRTQVVAVNVERRSGYDYRKGEPKTAKGYVTVRFESWRTSGKWEDRTYDIPARNIVSPWNIYAKLLKQYEDALTQRKQTAKGVEDSAYTTMKRLVAIIDNHLTDRGMENPKVIPSMMRFYGNSHSKTSEDILVRSHVEIDYNTAVAIAEALVGGKLENIPTLPPTKDDGTFDI